MAESRVPNKRYEEIGRELVETEPALAHIRGSEARIVYLSSDAERKSGGRPVLGQCERVPGKWKWAVPADFAVTLFEPNVRGLDDERIRIVIYHELLHVGIEPKKDGGESHQILPHDVEDFLAVVERFGLRWAEQG